MNREMFTAENEEYDVEDKIVAIGCVMQKEKEQNI